MLAQACKQCQCQAETKCRGECINHSRQQIIIFLDNKDSHTENTAVGSNQRQEHAQGLIQRRRNFLQDNLYHLHQCGNHQDKGNSLQIAQIKSVEHILLNKECHDSGDGEHECHRCRHAQCSLHFLGNPQERAVIGFPAITRNATFLCEVLRYNVDIYTIHDQKEARTILQGLENSGCQMVLCDVVTNSLAQEYGIPALLITSGIESVEDALNTAVQEGLARRKALELAQFFQDVIRAMPYDTLVSDEAGQDLFVSLSPELPDSVLAKAHSAIMQRTAEPHRSCLEENGIRYALQSTPIQMEGALRHVVTIEKSRLSIPLEKYGITYSDRQQAVDTFFDSFYGITQSFSTANLTLEQYLQSNRPLVVYGEPGTAKPQMVRMLYAKGPLSNAPLIKIDCAMLMHPGWKYLMASDRSPLMGDGCTLMMSHVEALTDEQFSELFSTIMALHTQERNRFFFVASSSSSGTMHPHYARLVDMLNCLMLQMPPLRSHLQDIPRTPETVSFAKSQAVT